MKQSESFYKGEHVSFIGSGALYDRKGIILSLDPISKSVYSMATVLFWAIDSEDDDQIMHVLVSNLNKYEPELAYPPIHKREESFIFTSGWNVAAAWNIILKDRPKILVGLKYINSFYETCLKENDADWEKQADGRMSLLLPIVHIDKDLALSDKTDLSIPILLIKTSQSYFPIDGRHRLYKAYHKQIELDAYLLSSEEASLIKEI